MTYSYVCNITYSLHANQASHKMYFKVRSWTSFCNSSTTRAKAVKKIL